MICIFSGKAWCLFLVLSIKGFALLYLFQKALSKTLGFQTLLEYDIPCKIFLPLWQGFYASLNLCFLKILGGMMLERYLHG